MQKNDRIFLLLDYRIHHILHFNNSLGLRSLRKTGSYQLPWSSSVQQATIASSKRLLIHCSTQLKFPSHANNTRSGSITSALTTFGRMTNLHREYLWKPITSQFHNTVLNFKFKEGYLVICQL